MKNILILFAIIFSIIIVHYYITRQVESFFNFSNESWNKNNIEGFFSNSNEQIINPALIKRKKKIDTELLPIESAKMDYYKSYKNPYGIVNNKKKIIKNCGDLTNHRGEKWDSSFSYQDPACCSAKLNMCCCLGEDCGNIKKCNDLINMKGNDNCDLNKDNNCIKPILNNYTMKSRDIWGKHNLKWDYKGVDQDSGAIYNEKNGVQPFKEITKKFCCKDGSRTAKGYTFYKGCTTCQTNNFNGNNYSPWNESSAEKYCMSWSKNRGKNVSDVFTEGECI